MGVCGVYKRDSINHGTDQKVPDFQLLWKQYKQK